MSPGMMPRGASPAEAVNATRPATRMPYRVMSVTPCECRGPYHNAPPQGPGFSFRPACCNLLPPHHKNRGYPPMNEIASAATAEANTLSRSLRPRHVTMIAIGGIVGAGLFVGSSAAIAAAGPAILATYALTGFVVLLIMRMLGEMAVDMPNVRSFTEFARVGLGNWAGFSVGWLYWFFWVVVVPVEAIAGAEIIDNWIDVPVWEIGIVLMVIMTAVNLLSARAYGEFEFWFSSIKVTAILAFILVAAAHIFGLIPPGGTGFSNLAAGGGFAANGWLAVLAAVST